SMTIDTIRSLSVAVGAGNAWARLEWRHGGAVVVDLFQDQSPRPRESLGITASPAGTLVASGPAGDAVALWTARDGRVEKRLAAGVARPRNWRLSGLRFSSDGAHRLGSSDEGGRSTGGAELLIWELASGQLRSISA